MNELPTFKAGSKEFYEAMSQFEKDVLNYKGDVKKIREDRSKVPAGVYYCDGKANDMFKAYLAGIAFMRSLAIQ